MSSFQNLYFPTQSCGLRDSFLGNANRAVMRTSSFQQSGNLNTSVEKDSEEPISRSSWVIWEQRIRNFKGELYTCLSRKKTEDSPQKKIHLIKTHGQTKLSQIMKRTLSYWKFRKFSLFKNFKFKRPYRHCPVSTQRLHRRNHIKTKINTI